jgi:hypothetical protein
MNKQTAEAKSQEFNNFERLTKNLLAVPKKEIDQKKAAYERAKSKKEKPAK